MAIIFEEQTKLNTGTGEVTAESTVIKRIRNDEPDFVKLYINAWCEFKQVKGINTAFLLHLLPSMTYANNGQFIFTNAALKRQIAEELNWSIKTACNRGATELKKLCNAGILKKIENGKYQVNPELIGKGEWKDIRKLRATFNLENGEVTHFYESEDEQ